VLEQDQSVGEGWKLKLKCGDPELRLSGWDHQMDGIDFLDRQIQILLSKANYQVPKD